MSLSDISVNKTARIKGGGRNYVQKSNCYVSVYSPHGSSIVTYLWIGTFNT
jgi:hypothetical protein